MEWVYVFSPYVSPEENMKHELAPTSFRVLCPRAVGELSMDGTYFYLVIYGGFLEQTDSTPWKN